VQVRPLSILPKDPLTTIVGDGIDEYHLDFFSKKIGPKIAGFYDLEFWSATIPQLAYNEPAIRLAIQAVSSLHDEVEKQEGSTIAKVDPSILKDYNNAIRYLVQGTTDRLHINATVVALFVCLEFLAGNEEAASIHINGGLKLIQDWRRRSKSSSSSSSPGTSAPSTPRAGSSSENDLMDELSSTFNRLAVHSKVFGKRMLNLELLPDNESDGNRYHFETMNHARDEGFAILGDAIGFISRATPVSYSEEGVSEEYYRDQRHIAARTLEWRRGYKDFARREQMTLSQMQARAGNMIQCLIICTYIWTCTCLSPYEEDYDKYTAEFQEVINLSKTIIDIPIEFLCNNVGRFQIDMGLIPALHLVGSRCRVASIRKEALTMLGAHHWREGLFDSFRSAQFIQVCMQLEETAKVTLMGLEPHEVDDYLPCEGARIHFVGVDKQPHNDTFLHSFYSKPYGAYGDWHVQQCSLPATPHMAEAEPTTTGIKAVPNSAYVMPSIFTGHAYQNSGSFSPEIRDANPSLKYGPVVGRDSFTVPNDATKTLDEKSNGMFYYHLVGAGEFMSAAKHSHQVLM
jgi:hypothetical protein